MPGPSTIARAVGINKERIESTFGHRAGFMDYTFNDFGVGNKNKNLDGVINEDFM